MVTPRMKANAAVSLSLLGAQDLIRTFNALPLRVQKRVVRSSVAKVARKMVKEVKMTIKTGPQQMFDSGLLYKSIGFRQWTSQRGDWTVGATIGPRHGFATLVTRTKKGKKRALTKKAITRVVEAGGSFRRAQYADPAKYGHLPELGTKRRPKRGAVQGKHAVRHAYLRSKDVMQGVMRREIMAGIVREATKLARTRRGY